MFRSAWVFDPAEIVTAGLFLIPIPLPIIAHHFLLGSPNTGLTKIASPLGEGPAPCDMDCDASNPFSVAKIPPKKCQGDVALAAKIGVHDPSQPVYEIPL